MTKYEESAKVNYNLAQQQQQYKMKKKKTKHMRETKKRQAQNV